jgi:hypothetical protein
LLNDYPLTIGSLIKQTEFRRGKGEVVYGGTRYTWSQLFQRVNGLDPDLKE